MFFKQLFIFYTINFLFVKKNQFLQCSEHLSNTIEQSSALLLTTLDTISLIYPKEMNYENDFLHIIFKLNNKNTTNKYRIEDAVYDNKTWSIYFILSNSTGGSELIRLRRKTNFLSSNKSVEQEQNDQYSFDLASNWIFNIVYKNQTSKLLSLDINLNKRKLYWFELNKPNQKWSLVVVKLNSNLFLNQKYLNHILIETRYIQFSNDGYSYISIARDNQNHYNPNDITLFISNNESLNLCHLSNMTCVDYFRSQYESTRPTTTKQTTTKNPYIEMEDVIDDEDYSYDDPDRTTNVPITSTTELIDDQMDPAYRFGKLMGVKYDQELNVLYLSDYLNDRIDKLSFSNDQFKLSNLETILKSDYLSNSLSHIALNPIMSFMFDNYIYWIDYEDGLKTSLYKSSCFRSIYKVKDVVSLKLVSISVSLSSKPKYNSELLSSLLSYNSELGSFSDLVSLKNINSKYRYPPDYVYYYNYLLNQNESAKFFEFSFKNKASNSLITNNSDYLNAFYIILILKIFFII